MLINFNCQGRPIISILFKNGSTRSCGSFLDVSTTVLLQGNNNDRQTCEVAIRDLMTTGDRSIGKRLNQTRVSLFVVKMYFNLVPVTVTWEWDWKSPCEGWQVLFWRGDTCYKCHKLSQYLGYSDNSSCWDTCFRNVTNHLKNYESKLVNTSCTLYHQHFVLELFLESLKYLNEILPRWCHINKSSKFKKWKQYWFCNI